LFWAQPGKDRHCGAASAPRPDLAGSSAIEGTAVARRRGRVRLFMPSRPGEFHPESLTGRVEDWRAGLGRSLYSLFSRPFVCECHTISTVPRFQPPPRRTQRADFPHLPSFQILVASSLSLPTFAQDDIRVTVLRTMRPRPTPALVRAAISA